MATPGNRVAPPEHPRETITATSDGMIFLSLFQCVYSMATEERKRIEEIGNERYLLEQIEEQQKKREKEMKLVARTVGHSVEKQPPSSPLPEPGAKRKRWM